QWAPGRILVAPNPGLPAAEFDKIIKAHGAQSSRKLNGIDVYVVEMPIQSHGREQALVQALARNPHMKFAEVDGAVPMQQTPTDPYFTSAWHLPIIQAPAAWDLATGSGITVAILDGGVESTHPDLAAHIVPGWNFYDNNSNTSDVNGHGTRVAGVAAAVGNNALGVTGGAWNAKIMPMRISDPAGSITYYSIVANSLTWAADRGARVANISYIVSDVATIQNAAQYMRNKGGVVVASAGNTGLNMPSPNTSTIITVAATDSADQRTSWSAYGPIVDVAAPGVGIWTTNTGAGYGAFSGTSFSSPLTAGVVALMLSANPALQPSQVDSILTSTADDLGTPGRDDYYGYGRINAYRAVAAAKSAASTDNQVPTVSISSPTGGTVKGIVTVGVSAIDNVGVTKVDLYAASALVATDIAAPYSFSWDTSTRVDGATTLTAKAYDAAGNVSSSTVNVSVANSTTIAADVTPPVVSISSPINGTTVSGNVSISVNASDNVAVSSVSLYVDGALKATGNGSIAYKWNSRQASNGAHSIWAVARDAAGNSSTQTIQVTK
ncbi:MAG: S8 family serine peptidase, partial [Fluviicoccus sp.]|uniref:S8 family serine peptidase n=1 Tax=Fluviicoccus sp. TaxID=2003552 RepID=UPI002720BB9B